MAVSDCIPMAIHSRRDLSEYVSGMLVRSGLTADSFFMLQRTALRNRGGQGLSLEGERK